MLIGIKIHEKRALPEIDFLSFLFCELPLGVKNLRRRIGFEYFAAMRQLLASGWSCVRMNKPRNVRVERFEWQACLDRRNGSTGPIAEVQVQLVQRASNSFAVFQFFSYPCLGVAREAPSPLEPHIFRAKFTLFEYCPE